MQCLNTYSLVAFSWKIVDKGYVAADEYTNPSWLMQATVCSLQLLKHNLTCFLHSPSVSKCFVRSDLAGQSWIFNKIVGLRYEDGKIISKKTSYVCPSECMYLPHFGNVQQQPDQITYDAWTRTHCDGYNRIQTWNTIIFKKLGHGYRMDTTI